MKTRIFAVYDVKAAAYLAPFTFMENGQAIRAFTDTVNDVSTMMSKHAGDFDLFRLGYFDDSSGEFTNDREFLIGGAAVKIWDPAEKDPRQMQMFGGDDGEAETERES